MVLAALFRRQSSSCETECNFVCNCMYISMSYQYCMYEFVGQNPAGLKDGLFQVSEFFEPIGMFHRNFPWARFR